MALRAKASEAPAPKEREVVVLARSLLYPTRQSRDVECMESISGMEFRESNARDMKPTLGVFRHSTINEIQPFKDNLQHHKHSKM